MIFADVYEPAVTAVFAKEIVTAADPLKLVPESPVPMVREFVVVPVALPLDAAVIRPFESTVILALVYEAAVTVVLASVRVIAVAPDPEASPLTVMDWFAVKYALVSSDHVLAAVFLRNPVVAVSAAMASRSPSQACTSDPMASPKLVRAADAVVAFVPPLAMASVEDSPAAVVALVAFPESAP